MTFQPSIAPGVYEELGSITLFAAADYIPFRFAWIVTEEVYDYYLEVVPPTAQDSMGFINGEPFSHNDYGVPNYLCFREGAGLGTNCYAFLGTVEEWRSFVPGEQLEALACDRTPAGFFKSLRYWVENCYRLPALLDYLETVIDKTLVMMFTTREMAEYWHIRSIAYLNAGEFDKAFQDAYASSQMYKKNGELDKASIAQVLMGDSTKAAIAAVEKFDGIP